MMAEPLSVHARAILEFVKAHPGVQAKYIAAELHIEGLALAKALTILQGRGLVDAKLDLRFDKWSDADKSAIRYFAKI